MDNGGQEVEPGKTNINGDTGHASLCFLGKASKDPITPLLPFLSFLTEEEEEACGNYK